MLIIIQETNHTIGVFQRKSFRKRIKNEKNRHKNIILLRILI